ncbi:hypothetical protein KP509_01G123100 [Ceratopteris richardii]|uniref:C3H1-type domain-containing protein n=1 Tax=Ceratopteris richardii TaxID=49495 RepID=A0A8T2VNW3_CERRI|nr:hypothetical protein KP509_01G123100 [Ceratopteris richardii]
MDRSMSKLKRQRQKSVTWPVGKKICEILLDDSWLWARGEESSEIILQREREMRVFEAVYPRLTSIPDSPSECQELTKEVDDAYVPEIMLDSLEDEEMEDDLSTRKASNSAGNGGFGRSISERAITDSQSGVLRGSSTVQNKESVVRVDAESNIAAAAAAACVALKALGGNDLVDEILLFEILKNPSLLEPLRCSERFNRAKGNDQEIHFANQDVDPSLEGSLDGEPYLSTFTTSILARKYGVSKVSPERMPVVANGSTLTRGSMDINLSTAVTSHSSVGLPAPYPCSGPLISTDTTSISAPQPLRICEKMNENSKTEPFYQANKFEKSHMHSHISSEDEIRGQNGLQMCDDMQMAMTYSPSKTHWSPCNSNKQRHTFTAEHMSNRPCEGSNIFSRKNIIHNANNKGGIRARKFCIYFNTSRGCRNGERCAFVHQSLINSHARTMAQ